MTNSIQPTQPAPSKSSFATIAALAYAVLIVIMVVAQLFYFDEFMTLSAGYNLPGGTVLAAALAPSIVALEVLSLPFLLRMTISPGFRMLSMVFGWIVAALWAFISIWLLSEGSHDTIGFFGTIIDVPSVWWAGSIPVFFAVLAAIASWGLWPTLRIKKG